MMSGRRGSTHEGRGGTRHVLWRWMSLSLRVRCMMSRAMYAAVSFSLRARTLAGLLNSVLTVGPARTGDIGSMLSDRRDADVRTLMPVRAVRSRREPCERRLPWLRPLR